LRSWQHALEENLILSLPNAGFRALKDAVDHPERVIRIEASDTVEPDVTDNLGPGPDLSIDLNAGCVEVRRTRKPPRIALVLAKAPPPNAPKTVDSDPHFCHAPFQRLFFCRSAYKSSWSRLM